MRKFLLSVLCVISLASCEQATGIQGTWYTGSDGISCSVTYKKNGTYYSYCHVEGLGAIKCEGKYEFIGEDEGTLYEYDRTEDGYYFEQPIVYHVVIKGRKMYVTVQGSKQTTEFHR